MPRVKIGSALPDRKVFDAEIARLRDLDVGDLRARWHTVFRRRPPPHLPRHLLFRVLAYRHQADHLGCRFWAGLPAQEERACEIDRTVETSGLRWWKRHMGA